MQISFETADSLRDAGFPQPAPKFGQFWYTKDGRMGLLTDEAAWMDNGKVFAPSATDILEHLPGWHLSFNSEGWKCWRGRVSFRGFKSPAEAAAAAWFHKNGKK